MTSEGPFPTDESIPEGAEEEPEEEEEFDGISLRERYGLVLLLIFVSYVLGGFSPRAVRRIGLVATAVLILLFLLSAMSGSDTAFGWTNLFLAVAELAALLAILARIAQHEVVTLQTVMGGIAAYALIGFTMAAVYRGLELLFADALFDGISGPGDYIYFSFVTLTTVGYGDITPAIDVAQRLAVVEMFVGQVFLITLVARLVSLWGVRTPKSVSR
jgi:voltage-gated potassium channel Kch